MKGLNGGVMWASRREDGNLPPEQVRMTMADFKVQLEERRKVVDGKATEYRTTRDEWNDKTKTHTTTRNELNAEVRELIVQVREQREIREQMNEIVRDKKSARSSASDAVKDTINYKSVAERLFSFVGESEFELVETLAEQISDVLLNEFNVPWLRLRVNKQGALKGVRDVGVIIERGSEER